MVAAPLLGRQGGAGRRGDLVGVDRCLARPCSHRTATTTASTTTTANSPPTNHRPRRVRTGSSAPSSIGPNTAIGRATDPTLTCLMVLGSMSNNLDTDGEHTMHHELHTEIDIDATPEVVWQVLTDLDRYVEWNPFITSSAGIARVGERLVNRMEPPGGRPITFKPKVTVVEEGQTLEWLGRLAVPGLFDGRHRFELEPSGDGTSSPRASRSTACSSASSFVARRPHQSRVRRDELA